MGVTSLVPEARLRFTKREYSSFASVLRPKVRERYADESYAFGRRTAVIRLRDALPGAKEHDELIALADEKGSLPRSTPTEPSIMSSIGRRHFMRRLQAGNIECRWYHCYPCRARRLLDRNDSAQFLQTLSRSRSSSSESWIPRCTDRDIKPFKRHATPDRMSFVIHASRHHSEPAS
jgi:hypothetical protein